MAALLLWQTILESEAAFTHMQPGCQGESSARVTFPPCISTRELTAHLFLNVGIYETLNSKDFPRGALFAAPDTSIPGSFKSSSISHKLATIIMRAPGLASGSARNAIKYKSCKSKRVE